MKEQYGEALLFRSGMAIGWDQAIAEACLNLSVQFEAHVPLVGQELVWRNMETIARFHRLLAASSALYIYHDVEWNGSIWKARTRFTPSVYQELEPNIVTKEEAARLMNLRNIGLLDNPTRVDLLIALWNGSQGGTGNCIRDAGRRRIPIQNCWHIWKRLKEEG